MWLEEGNDLILSCAQLSSVLGLQKSFSTSDITQLPVGKLNGNASNSLYAELNSGNQQLRHAVSEMALNSLQRCGYMLDGVRLDNASRSCSTWVAVGELASTSQLPSPHGGPATTGNVNTSSSQQQLTAGGACISTQPTFTAADLIRSVNKKVRQNYIRRRLLTTYRAIERLSQSEFNLDQLEAAAVAATVNAGPGPTKLIVPTTEQIKSMTSNAKQQNATDATAETAAVQETETDADAGTDVISVTVTQTTPSVPTISVAKPKSPGPVICPQLKKKISMNINRNLTIHDIEKERGRPLSKYDRNMMIFNWLHSLDETSTVEDYNVL